MREINKKQSAVRHMAKLPASLTLAGLVATTPVLAETVKDTVLPAVNVDATRVDSAMPSDKSYNKATTSVGKMPTAKRDIPQSETTITQRLIADQGDATLKDAMRNVPGLTFNAGEGGRTGDNITIRGFAAGTDIYLDGVRDIGQYNRDLFNTDRVDALFGPSSMLFGRGSTGGLVNQVSKQPFAGKRTEVSGTIGSNRYQRATVDSNLMVGETAAMRLNAMIQKADGDRDGTEQNRWGVAPSLRLGIGEPTELTLSYYHLTEDNIPDYGVPYFQGKPIDVPQNRFYGLPDWDYEKNKADIGTAIVQHKLSSNVTLRNTLRYGKYHRDVWPTAPRLDITSTGGVLADKTTIIRNRPGREGTEKIFSNQFDLMGEFRTGDIKHQILAGLDYTGEKSKTYRWSHKDGAPTTTLGNPDPHPAMQTPVRLPGSDVNFDSNVVGIYAQDMVALTYQWKVLAGLRWDRFKGDYTTRNFNAKTNSWSSTDTARTDRIASYRTGVIYQPDGQQSYYATLGTSFNPSGEAYALDPRGTNTPPEKNRNLEIGTKLDLLDGDLSLRAAAFRITKTHERNTDPLKQDVYLLSGKRHTDGIDFGIAGRLTEKLEAFGNVTLMKSKIDSHIDSNSQGKEAANTPRYTIGGWTTYALGMGWKVGGGFDAKGKRYTGVTNTTELPAYVRWDAMVAYDKRDYSIQLNATNLLDKKYYEGLYAGHTVTGPGRGVQLTGSYRFN
ncbi:catecholate siderophore receptor [Chitinivorax tropicus]|uniref:Catecholate siderophore receptor n=1 Tax=Chitinivorax tropicus TaxID=714531 RepID=A0A840MLD5_9PROT|nr:TonB-dependent siderophore receptor [Chitinivorax tropicus]MBB5019220.1 catecholate siderophore receptor [Chitinivorax tropicus]